MNVFETYPNNDAELMAGLRCTNNCRRGYALDLQRRTGQTHCAYCGISLVDDYYHWLLMCVDHVVPVSEGRRLEIADSLVGGIVNLVLCCSGCNGFNNKYRIADVVPGSVSTLSDFTALRDRVYEHRRALIAERRALEVAFFESRPWE